MKLVEVQIGEIPSGVNFRGSKDENSKSINEDKKRLDEIKSIMTNTFGVNVVKVKRPKYVVYGKTKTNHRNVSIITSDADAKKIIDKIKKEKAIKVNDEIYFIDFTKVIDCGINVIENTKKRFDSDETDAQLQHHLATCEQPEEVTA